MCDRIDSLSHLLLYGCTSASKITLKDISGIGHYQATINVTKHEPYIKFIPRDVFMYALIMYIHI